jgi:hypothetical protein
MTYGTIWSWTAVLFLGAFHGLNPGMGWLFAVALGMQERRRRAVWLAMMPLTLGHTLAIGAAVLVAVAAGATVPVHWLKYPVATILTGLGVYRLLRHRHPRLGGMRVGMPRLTAWSFLMATAHGAGLMVIPIILGMAAPGQAEEMCHIGGRGVEASAWTGLIATAVHTAGYLGMTAAAAWLVFEKLGLGLLRKAWFNVDLIWAGALLATGAFTLAI